MVKSFLRYCFGKFLQIGLLRQTWLKAIEASLLTKNLDGFRQTQTLFIEFARKNRIHLVGANPRMDLDISIIDYVRGGNHYDPKLFDILQKSCTTMRDLLENNYEQDRKVSKISENLGQNLTNYSIFRNLPELRATDNHYLFLYALAISVNAKRVIDLGTASGSSLCAFLAAPEVEFVDTYDLTSLYENKNWVSSSSSHVIHTYLDIHQARWKQHLVNLEDSVKWNEHLPIFQNADIVLVDTQHLGYFETLMGERFVSSLGSETIFVWDDIRLSSMLDFWYSLEMSKMDIGGIGHVSGTGISRIQNK